MSNMLSINVPHEYTTNKGEKKTVFYRVGVAFVNRDKDSGKLKSISLDVGMNVISRKFVLFPMDQKQANDGKDATDEIPF